MSHIYSHLCTAHRPARTQNSAQSSWTVCYHYPETLEKQEFHALCLEEPSFNFGICHCGKRRVAEPTWTSAALWALQLQASLNYSTLPARLRDKGSFLCSTFKTALIATISAENQPCAANIARSVMIQSESRKETDVDRIVCYSLHTSIDLKSHHQSQWISTVPAQTDLSCEDMDFSLNSPCLSYNEHHLRPGAAHYCQNKTLYLSIAVMHSNRIMSYALHPREEQFRFSLLSAPGLLCWIQVRYCCTSKSPPKKKSDCGEHPRLKLSM